MPLEAVTKHPSTKAAGSAGDIGDCNGRGDVGLLKKER
jgi:hypothetical protein